MSIRTMACLAAAAVLVVTAQAGAAPAAGLSAAAQAAAASVARGPCGVGTRSLASVTGATSLRVFNDFIEDAGGAPDYCAANFVTNDNEAITIGAHIHNRNGFVSGDVYALFLDTDRNASTGGTAGADYVILLSDGAAQLGRWDGSKFDPSVPQGSLRVVWIRDLGPVVQIAPADLGNPTGFNFVLASVRADEGDVAPDNGTWTYELTPLTLSVKSLKVGAAKAGKPFVARMTVISSDFDVEVTDGTIACSAKVGAKTIVGTGAFNDESAVCTWRLPKNTRGKRLTGSIAVTYEGVQAKRTFSVKVR
jgi:hypothetical protein